MFDQSINIKIKIRRFDLSNVIIKYYKINNDIFKMKTEHKLECYNRHFWKY